MGRVAGTALLALVVVVLSAVPGPAETDGSVAASRASVSDPSQHLVSGLTVARGGAKSSVVDDEAAGERVDVRTRHLPVAVLPFSRSADTFTLAEPVEVSIAVCVRPVATRGTSRAPPVCRADDVAVTSL